MNNLRLFYQKKLSANLTGNLDKKQSHYVNKVMRLKENDKFNVFNESGEWVAKINKILKGLIEFKIIKQVRSKDNKKDIKKLVVYKLHKLVSGQTSDCKMQGSKNSFNQGKK